MSPGPLAYHVIWDEDKKRWLVRRENAVRARGAHTNKMDAVLQAKAIVKGKKRVQLVIHRKNGEVHKEYVRGFVSQHHKAPGKRRLKF